jgi:hypothetical protein
MLPLKAQALPLHLSSLLNFSLQPTFSLRTLQFAVPLQTLLAMLPQRAHL